MTAPAPGSADLREALARTLFICLCPYADPNSADRLWDAPTCFGYRITSLRFADALIAGPLAAGAAARAKVEAENKAQIAALSAERDGLREALEFYADPADWTGAPWRLAFESPGRDGDGFDVARAALRTPTPATEKAADA